VTGTADLISCGAIFLANPDLPRRLARGGAEGGYTDHPVVAENRHRLAASPRIHLGDTR
jgi:2,4-dienoyl-CoA reductase-like NADH-dependent reductase (Old Yellow Enzyme family)